MRAWLKSQNINPKILGSILIVLLAGLLCGFFATAEYKTLPLTIEINDSSKIKVFLLTFSQQFWFLFLIWLLAFIPFGFIGTYFVLYFKGFILGVTFGFIVKAEALFGTYSFFKLILWQAFILLPLIVYLAYIGIRVNLTRLPVGTINSSANININSYLSRLLFASTVIAIYSFIIAISMTSVVTT